MASCSGTSREYTLTLNYNQGPQNIAANTSVVYWSLVFNCGQNYYQNGSTTDNFQAYINGTCVYNANRAISFPGKYTGIVIAEGSITVGHNDDGTKTIGTSASFRPGRSASYYPGNIDCSGSLALSTIPRASVLGTVNFNNFWSSFNVTYTKYYAGFTCKLRVSYPTISMIQTFDNYESGSTVSLSDINQDAIMQKLISSGSTQLGFVIETWSGGSKIGESIEKIITISKPLANQITNVSDFDVDSGFNISTSKTYPNYTSTINVSIAGITVFSTSNISTTYKVNFNSTQLTQIYNAMKTVNNSPFIITVNSFYGASNCGSVSTTKTGTITNASPTLSGFSWQTINNLTLHDNQTIIKGKSNVKVTIQKATAYKGATISYYQVTIGSMTSKVTELETILNGCDDKEIIVRAVDSRNNVVTKQLTCLKFIKYTDITLESLNYIRGSGGIGGAVTIDFNGSMFNENFGLQGNTITANYFFKEVNAKDYIQGTTVITPTVNSKYSNVVAIKGDLGANGFSINKNFNLKVVVNDKLTSYTREIVIAKGTPAMAIHEDGIAFGSFYDESVGGALQLLGQNIINIMYPVGIVVEFGKNVDPNVLPGFKGTTWTRFAPGQVTIGYNASDTDFNSFGKTGGIKTFNNAHVHTINPHNHSMGGHIHAEGDLEAIIGATNNSAGSIGYIASNLHNVGAHGGATYAVKGTGFGSNETFNHWTKVIGNTASSGMLYTNNSVTLSTNSAQSTQSIVQPYIVVAKWIRTV